MTDEIYYMTKSKEKRYPPYLMTRLGTEIPPPYLMYKIEPNPEVVWVRIRRVTFSSISFVLNTSWDYATPGNYINANGLVTIPWANQVKIVPIGGYHTVAAGSGIPYGIGLDLKTQLEVVSWSFDQNSNGIPDQMTAVAAEATAYLMSKQPAIMALGTDKTLAWGCGDNPIVDNGDTSIQFDIYASA